MKKRFHNCSAPQNEIRSYKYKIQKVSSKNSMSIGPLLQEAAVTDADAAAVAAAAAEEAAEAAAEEEYM
jgi:hypothetical protein